MIVGISGFKGAGKGTIANILCEHGFVRMSCADPLKDIIATLFLWPRHLLEGNTEESRRWRETPSDEWDHLAGHGVFGNDDYITPRLVMQRIGTDLFRNQVDNDFWVTLLRKRAEGLAEKYKNGITLGDDRVVPFRGVVIDDARFLNELSHCDYTICVVRHEYSSEEISRMHPSETEHLRHKFDQIVLNTRDLNSLVRDVHQYVLPKVITQ